MLETMLVKGRPKLEDEEAEEETEAFDAPTDALALAETDTDAETPLEATDEA